MIRALKFVAIVCSLSFFIVAGCSTTPSAPNYLSLLDDGYKKQDKTLIEQAGASLEGVLAKGSPTYSDYYNAALAKYRLADYLDLKSEKGVDKSGEAEKAADASREYLKKAIELNPDFYEAYYLKYMVLGKKFAYVGFPRLMQYIGEISIDLQRAKELRPNDAQTKMLEGLASANSFPAPDPQETIDLLKEALKINPKFGEVYYHIAMVELKNDKKDDAIQSLKKAIETDPYCFWAKKKLAELEK